MKKENIKKITTVLRVLVGIALIAFLLWRFDIRQVLANIANLDLNYLAYALGIYLVFIFVSAYRWQVLLDFKKFGVPYRKTAIIYFISLFFANFLPTTIGGDVMRTYYIMKERKADALATILVDRILGFIGLFVFALFAALYPLIKKEQTEFLPTIIIGFFMIVIITYLFFSNRAHRRLEPLLAKIRILKLGERLNRLHEAGTDFGGAWGVIMSCIFLSIIIQGMLAVVPFFILRGLGNFEVGILPFFIYVPIINVISMIPISIGGLGVRENSYVILFSRVGLAGETSLTISLVSFVFVYFIWSLVGGILFIFFKKK